MYLLETIYPFVLASANMAVGWLLYDLFASPFAGLLVVVGLLVILALAGTAISDTTAERSPSA